MRRLILVSFLAFVTVARPARVAADSSAEQSAVLSAMKDELARSAQQLQLPGVQKPYYIAYLIADRDMLQIAASFGAIVTRHHNRDRYLNVDVRIGDYTFDNTNFVGRPGMGFMMQRRNSLPYEEDYDAVRRELWLATDAAYKEAVETFEQKRAARKNQTESPERVGNFSQEAPVHLVAEAAPALPDPSTFEKLIKSLSEVFREFPEIQASRVSLTAVSIRRYFASTENSIAAVPQSMVRLVVTCETQADDGMRLKHFASFMVRNLDELPTEGVLKTEVRRVATELTRVRKAPVIDDYTGPVLFEGRAAAQITRELLADNLSGTPPPTLAQEGMGRMMMSRDSELASQVGHPILPASFRVVDDPTLDRVGGVPLVGKYALDEEGVLAQKVVLVDRGVLKGFLMSRTPRKGFPKSNGHGRGGLSWDTRGRIGNLIVSTDRGFSDADLRKQLLAEARKAGQSYAIIVRLLDEPEITGEGDPMSLLRSMMSSVMGGGDARKLPAPLATVKITLDGKEEIVRGSTLAPIPIAAFKEIVAAGRTPTTYNYPASASGPSVLSSFKPISFVSGEISSQAIPTSIVAPALLFKDVTVRKPTEPQRRLPLLPHPAF